MNKIFRAILSCFFTWILCSFPVLRAQPVESDELSKRIAQLLADEDGWLEASVELRNKDEFSYDDALRTLIFRRTYTTVANEGRSMGYAGFRDPVFRRAVVVYTKESGSISPVINEVVKIFSLMEEGKTVDQEQDTVLLDALFEHDGISLTNYAADLYPHLGNSSKLRLIERTRDVASSGKLGERELLILLSKFAEVEKHTPNNDAIDIILASYGFNSREQLRSFIDSLPSDEPEFSPKERAIMEAAIKSNREDQIRRREEEERVENSSAPINKAAHPLSSGSQPEGSKDSGVADATQRGGQALKLSIVILLWLFAAYMVMKCMKARHGIRAAGGR